ncbi:MAG: hypothetical protein ACW99U_16890 [Candidatus Thorarchaeota archaeon]
MASSFLTVVTRTCDRPKMLGENIESVKMQTDQDIEQIFIVDRQKKGVVAADKVFIKHIDRVDGDYAIILDDDCWLTTNTYVERLRAFIENNNFPNIVLFRSTRPAGPPSSQTVFPTEEVWGKRPLHQTTNCLCYIVKSVLWKRWIEYFGIKPHGGDWWFLDALINKDNNDFLWMESEPLAESRQLGRGRLFENAKPGWFEQVAKEQGLVNLGKDDWRLQLWKGC